MNKDIIKPTILVCSNGIQSWHLDGKLHREDGPAIIRPDGYQVWWLNGVRVSAEEVFNKLPKEKQLNIIFNNLNEWK